MADPALLIAAAERLVEAVSFDVNGIAGKGGNGGLTSNATIRAADECRLAISRYKRAQAEDRPTEATSE